MNGFKGNMLLEFCMVVLATSIFIVAMGRLSMLIVGTIYSYSEANKKIHEKIYTGMQKVDPERIPCLEDFNFTVKPEVSFVAGKICTAY